MELTKVSVNALKVKWRIENVKSWLQKRDDTLYSPQFIAEAFANTRWKLGLSQNWQLAEKYVCLFLQRDVEDGGPQLIELGYELSFLAGDESTLKSKSFKQQFFEKTVSNLLTVKQLEILFQEQKAYVPGGVLTICCKLWNTLLSVLKVKSYCLKSVIGTKKMTLTAAVENFHPSSSAVVNFLPHSEDISLISLDVFLICDSGKKNYEYGFHKRHVECKGVSWYSLKLSTVDSEYQIRIFRESSNLIKCSPVEISAFTNYTNQHFMYYPKDIMNLQLVVYYHPGVALESIEIKLDNFENFPSRSADSEIKMPDSEVQSGVSSCISLTKMDKEEEECPDSAGFTGLPLPTLNDDSATIKDSESKIPDSKEVQFGNSSCISSTKLGNDERECPDSVVLTGLKLPSLNDDSDTIKDLERVNMPGLEIVPSSTSKSPSLAKRANEEEGKLHSDKNIYLPLTTLKDDLTSLYHDRLFGDITIQFDTETFPAHRILLSARSPVMKKNPSEYIQVPGISRDTAGRMLQFLYTNCTGELDMQIAKDLYVASYTYDITSLKAHCSTFMKKNLHSSNVCDFLFLADMHQDKDLESSAQEYILTNDAEVFYSEEWKIFMKNYSGLAAQVMYLNFTKNI